MGCNENNPCKGSNVKVAVSRCNHKCNPPTIYTTEILKPNCVCGNNALTQCMLMRENVKYVIKYDFTLLGEEITVPKNCILEFDGGSLKNGIIVGQDTVFINVGDVDIWGTNLIRRGTWKEHSGGGGSSEEDKPYDPEAHSGLGRKTLQLKDGSNILTQEDFDQENTVYVISYDFDLNGETIEFPEGCILDFEGGSLNNGRIVLDDVDIHAGRYQIFGDDLTVVSYSRELNPNATKFQPSIKRILYASWFGLKDTGNNVDILEKALATLKNCGTLILDTDVHIEKPVHVNRLYYTAIKGAVGNDPIPGIIPKFHSTYFPTVANECLFNINSEGLSLKNVGFDWQYPDPIPTNPPSTIDSYLMKIEPNDTLQDLDVNIEACTFISKYVGGLISAKGRGVYVHDCLLHHTAWVSAVTPHMIHLIGYASDSTSIYLKPEDCMRGVSIKNNRFHEALTNYMVWFEQDPDNEYTTFTNPVIEGNICDMGCAGVGSNSRLRGLLVCGNTFSVKNHASRITALNRFENSINGFSFVDNVISTIEDADEDPLQNAGETWFVYSNKNVEFENINISGNTYDVQNIGTVVRIDGRDHCRNTDGTRDVDITKYPSIKQLSVTNNTFSGRCFQSYMQTLKSLCTLMDAGFINLSITANTVDNKADSNRRVFGMYFAEITGIQPNDESQFDYPKLECEWVNGFVGLNTGTFRDIINTPNHDFVDVHSTNSLIQRPVSTQYRDFAGMYKGVSLYDTTINKAIWWNGTKWADANGYNGAPSSGTTVQRPTMLLNFTDSGFRYFDTTINKTLIFRGALGTQVERNEVSADTPLKISNPCTEGNRYLISCSVPDDEHSVYFCNEDESSKVYAVQSKHESLTPFVAPDPVQYPYVVFEVLEDSYMTVFQENAWWEEEDGAKAGVNRSGTFAQAPAASDIYDGFMYMINDGANHFPIYASISGNPATVAWYKADGTQYNG